MQSIDALQFQHAIHVQRLAHRIVHDRPAADGEFQVEPHRLENGQQIRKDDGGIDPQSLNRRAHHFATERRILAQFEKRDLGPHLAVFRHVAARLPHQPDRRYGGRFTATGTHKQTVMPGRLLIHGW